MGVHGQAQQIRRCVQTKRLEGDGPEPQALLYAKVAASPLPFWLAAVTRPEWKNAGT